MTDKQRRARLRAAVAALKKTTRGYTPDGVFWKQAMRQLAELDADLVPEPSVPALGPIFPGGPSILTYDLTHITSGMSDPYPAFDGPFGAGKRMLAPERLTVTRQSSARRRDGTPNGKAFYATGDSTIRYWVAHIDSRDLPDVGDVFAKGQVVARVSANHEVPHGHWGVDARALIGRMLEHRTDYQHGSPTIGAQLAKGLS